MYEPETAKISDLRAHPKNYRAHPEEQLAHLVQSLTEYGQYRNVVVANDSTILAGHGVVEAAASAGWDEIQIIRLPFGPDDLQAHKILVADNEIARLAEIDDRMLSDALKELAAADQLLGTGFDAAMVANLVFVTRAASEIASMDEAAQWIGLPTFDIDTADEIVLVLHFDDDEGREQLIEKLAVNVSKKTRQT